MRLRTKRVILAVGALALVADSMPAQEPDFVLEEVDRLSAVTLTAVSGMAITADGRRLIVAQPQENHLKVIDTRSGTVSRILGREGGGPGEFRSIRSVGVVGDTIVAVDLRQRRVSLYSVTGDHIRTARVLPDHLDGVGGPALPVRLTPDGTYWAEPPLSYMRVADGAMAAVPIVLVSEADERVRPIAMRSVEGTISMAEVGNRVLVFVQPLVIHAVAGYAQDGTSLVLAENEDGSVRLRRFDRKGALMYDQMLREPPMPVPLTMRDSLFDVFASMFEQGGRAAVASAKRAAREHVRIPNIQPPITRVVVADNGSAWLRRGLSNRWLIIGADGQKEATVRARRGLELFVVAGDHAWGVWDDELGVPYILLLRVRPAL